MSDPQPQSARTLEDRRVEYVRVEDLPPDPRNPKLHSLPDLEAAMDRFGYTEPLLLDERTGLLAAGHGRREALLAKRERGGEAPRGVTVGADGSWLVPVVRGWASRDDEEAAAYLVASNRLAEVGGWADRELATLLRNVTDTPLGLSGVGFSNDEVLSLLSASGVLGLEAGSFLDDLAGDRRVDKDELTGDAPLPVGEAVQLLLTFSTRTVQGLMAGPCRVWIIGSSLVGSFGK